MSIAAVQHDLPELLARAGAERMARGRADCPRCGGKRTVSYTDEVFCCHHAGCNFCGNTFTLAKELGLGRRLPREEWLALRRKREEAHRAAENLAARIKARRLELCETHRSLSRITDAASEALRQNAEHETAWSALAFAHTELPRVRAELLMLEAAPVPERVTFLAASKGEGQAAIERIICQGGIVDGGGKFLELG